MSEISSSETSYSEEDLAKVTQHMLEFKQESIDFVVNGTHYGRGDAYYNASTRNQQKHTTLGLKVWKIAEENLEEITENLNHFHDSHSYLIEWHSQSEKFQLNTTKLLATQNSRIYFQWRGSNAPKGPSPLPEDIDPDTPVERIVQWSEPPVFLRLFAGSFVVHSNEEPSKLYILRGEIENEAHLFQVALKRASLRSRTSFVVHSPENKETILWHGTESNLQCRKVAVALTENVFGKFAEIYEGSESALFLKVLGGNINDDYFSLLNTPSKLINYTPKLFYLTAVTGELFACAVENCLCSVHTTPFPFLQQHLYSALHPALFILDDNDEIWVWQGWNDDKNNEHQEEYEAAKAIAIQYGQVRSKSVKEPIVIRKVQAGKEPQSFTNLFPTWEGSSIASKDVQQPEENQENPVIAVISAPQ